MGRRSFTDDSADRNCPSALFAGVLNDYIISSVCSTLLFYGGFSIAVKKKEGEEERKKKRNIKAAIWFSVCDSTLSGKGDEASPAVWGVGYTQGRPSFCPFPRQENLGEARSFITLKEADLFLRFSSSHHLDALPLPWSSSGYWNW